MSPPPPRYAREKLLHAIVFFITNTAGCQKLKLFKLLYFFDFAIYRQTGRTATGLDYFAWPMGPVPTALYEELGHPSKDMSAVLSIREAPRDEPDPNFKSRGLKISARVKFDESFFTKRELQELARIAEIFRDAKAEQMTEVSHLRGQPWHQVYEVERRAQAVIPYELALDGTAGSISKEEAEEIEREAREVAALFE